MDKYSIGEVVTVVVTGIAPYGIFVQMPDGSQGLIHISEISDGLKIVVTTQTLIPQ